MTQEYAYGMWVIAAFIPPMKQWKAFLLTKVPESNSTPGYT